MNPEQLAAIAAADARIAEKAAQAEQNSAVPTQRTRTAAQGLTLGFSDEIEAALRNPFNAERRAETLAEIRGGISDYQEARPYESLGYELGGAVLPAIASLGTTAPLTAAATGGRVASRLVPKFMSGSGFIPSTVRAAFGGAATGAAYEAGTGEGGVAERAADAVTGVAPGAVGGAAGRAIFTPILRGASSLVNIARQRLGGGGGRAVTAELRRLAAEGGKSLDEIADDLISGRIMAENKTLKDAVRGYARTSGGPAQARMQEGLTSRAQMTFDEAGAALRAGLSDEADDNILRAVRRDDAAAREAEDAAYAKFETGSVSPDVQQEVERVVNLIPSAADDIQTALRARGAEPLFEMVDGSPVFSRAPTPMEAEIVRRAINDSATAAFRNSRGVVGTAFSDVEGTLRQNLDANVPGLGDVRAGAALLRAGRDAFDAGQKAIRSGADQVQIDFADLASPEAISAYRAGFMDELRKRFRGQQPASVVAQLNSDQKNLGQILRVVFPEESLDDVVQKLGTAEGSQAIKGYALGQSATAPTEAAAKRAGSGISPAALASAASGNVFEMATALQRFLPTRNTGLTDAQNMEVVNVLLSENPDFVRRAMADSSGWGMLDRAVSQVAERLALGGARASAVGGTQAASGLLGPN
jgi:hypothetical protein